MELFIAWVVFSLVAGVIASSKGLSSAKFIVVSLLLSPLVGILVALGSRPDLEALERRRVAAGGLKKCPACAEAIKAEAIKAEAIVCRYCGRDLLAPMPAPVITSEPDASRATLANMPLASSESLPAPSPTVARENGEDLKVFGFLSTRAYYIVIGTGAITIVVLLALLGWLSVEREQRAHTTPIAASETTPSRLSGPAFYRPMNRAVTAARVIADFGPPDVDDSSANDRPRPPMPARVLSYRQADVKVLFLADAPMNTPPPYKGWIFLGFTDGSSKQALDSTEALRRLDLATKH